MPGEDVAGGLGTAESGAPWPRLDMAHALQHTYGGAGQLAPVRSSSLVRFAESKRV